MAITLCTFNVNNLFLRYKFGSTFPGDMSELSASANPKWGYLPLYKKGLFELCSATQREITQQVLFLEDGKRPDILCLQEVESMQALRAFNEHYLGGYYPYALLVDSRDMRQIDVGVLSRYPIARARSNVDLIDPVNESFPWLFSRDCLELTFDFNKSGSKRLTVFVNHFKSKLVQGATAAENAAQTEEARQKRQRQAAEVSRILHARFPGSDYGKAMFAVVGDLNDEPQSSCIRQLIEGASLENALDRLPESERWTHYYKSKGQVSQFDYLLLSPKLSALSAGALPFVQRRGIGFREASKRDQLPLPLKAKLVRKDDDTTPLPVDFRFERLPGVTADLAASDHCPVTLTLPF